MLGVGRPTDSAFPPLGSRISHAATSRTSRVFISVEEKMFHFWNDFTLHQIQPYVKVKNKEIKREM